jgi:hypothetical protein
MLSVVKFSQTVLVTDQLKSIQYWLGGTERGNTELISEVRLKGEVTKWDIYSCTVLPFWAGFENFVIIWQNSGVDGSTNEVSRQRVFVEWFCLFIDCLFVNCEAASVADVKIVKRSFVTNDACFSEARRNVSNKLLFNFSEADWSTVMCCII